MERILLGNRDRNPYVNALKASERTLNEVFSSLGGFIAAPTIGDLRDVISGGIAVKVQFISDVADALASIKIPAIRSEQEKKLGDLGNELESLILKAMAYKGRIIDFITDDLIELHDDGKIRFSTEADNLIDEYCKIYVETDDQMKVYELSHALADTLSKLQPYVEIYRFNDAMQAVRKIGGMYEANNGFVISMPDRLATIKQHDDERRRELKEHEERKAAERERTKDYPVNVSMDQAAAIYAERERERKKKSEPSEGSDALTESDFE